MQSISTTNVFGGWRASAKGIQPCEAQHSRAHPNHNTNLLLIYRIGHPATQPLLVYTRIKIGNQRYVTIWDRIANLHTRPTANNSRLF